MAVEDSAAGLAAELAIEGPLVAGRAGLAVISVANRGSEPLLVSRRLNLMEGDLRLLVTGPTGSRRTVSGWQFDSGIDRVELPPGRRILGAVNLLETGDGSPLAEPGDYVLAAEYFPSPQMAPVEAEGVAVAVGAADAPDDRELAALLRDEALRKALVLADSDAAPERLRALADGFAGAIEAELARLILAAETVAPTDWARAEREWGSRRLALWILSLATAPSAVGQRLATSLAAYFANSGTKAEAARREALSIMRREPLPSS